jgi:hypothetical protein
MSRRRRRVREAGRVRKTIEVIVSGLFGVAVVGVVAMLLQGGSSPAAVTPSPTSTGLGQVGQSYGADGGLGINSAAAGTRNPSAGTVNAAATGAPQSPAQGATAAQETATREAASSPAAPTDTTAQSSASAGSAGASAGASPSASTSSGAGLLGGVVGGLVGGVLGLL